MHVLKVVDRPNSLNPPVLWFVWRCTDWQRFQRNWKWKIRYFRGFLSRQDFFTHVKNQNTIHLGFQLSTETFFWCRNKKRIWNGIKWNVQFWIYLLKKSIPSMYLKTLSSVCPLMREAKYSCQSNRPKILDFRLILKCERD